MKLTPKQELFITEYMANNFNATQAYIKVYGVEDEGVAASAANRLLRNVKVKTELEQKLNKKAQEAGITVDFVLNGIKDIAVKGKKESDKLKAFELLGKHLKLFTEKIEADTNNKNDNTVRIKLEGDLKEWAK